MAETSLPSRAVLPSRHRAAASRVSCPLGVWAPLLGVVGLSLFINAWGLSESGYGNTYYAAAVRSMTESWHNFFFGAFDPGGFITVDKPPVFLWIDAASVWLFGYSSWSLLLPSAVAGAVAVASALAGDAALFRRRGRDDRGARAGADADHGRGQPAQPAGAVLRPGAGRRRSLRAAVAGERALVGVDGGGGLASRAWRSTRRCWRDGSRARRWRWPSS